MHAVLQIAVAAVILVVLYLIIFPTLFREDPSARVVDRPLNKDYLYQVNEDVPVIEGLLPLTNGTISINTKNPCADEFLILPRSVNRPGGTEYSYSFWMRYGISSTYAGRNILLRGDPRTSEIVSIGEPMTEAQALLTGGRYALLNNTKYQYQRMTTRVVKAPLIRFATADEAKAMNREGDATKIFAVEFNTLGDPHNITFVDTTVASTIPTGSWVLCTFAFEDNKDIDGGKSGVTLRVFVNDKLIHTYIVYDALRLNEAPLHIFPGASADTGATGDYVADITYYNYALKTVDVERVFRQGFNNSLYTTPKARKAKNIQAKFARISVGNELRAL